ncbi:hypothetical protein IGI04_031152 [Brassica rapa subsp. trilocularis]|uniref:Uncharacterized protein n=1 Tax=Brassica rapa subsp. trilocularis TaxID=1813537 RepID=A0ABQ7LSS5_BRACM|nr:hypothetical protein IGI04_031152 [Brassica rapa subsp. trilocularis]
MSKLNIWTGILLSSSPPAPPASPLPVFLSHDSIFNSLMSCISYSFFQLYCSGSTVNATGRDLCGLVLLVGVHQSGPLLRGLLDNCFRHTSLHFFILHVCYHQLFISINLFNSTSAMKRLAEDPHRKRPQPHLLLTSCVNPATGVDGILFRRPDLFLQSLISRGSPHRFRLVLQIHNVPYQQFKSSWAWPSTLAEAASPVINLLKSRNLQHIVSQSISVLVSLVNFKSFDGFIEVFILSLLQYHSVSKQFSVDSPDLLSFSSSSLVEDKILQSCLHSMNGDVLSDPFPSYCFSLLTGLFPYVAVCTGPEGAIKITSVFLVGEGCLLTSLVTKSQRSDFSGNALSTHSSHVSNSLSTSYEDLLCLIAFAVVVYGTTIDYYPDPDCASVYKQLAPKQSITMKGGFRIVKSVFSGLVPIVLLILSPNYSTGISSD